MTWDISFSAGEHPLLSSSARNMRSEWVLAPAGVELHGDFIRQRWERWLNGAGSRCLSCFRAGETLQVVKKFKPTFNKFVEVHAHSQYLPKEHICVHTSENTRVRKSADPGDEAESAGICSYSFSTCVRKWEPWHSCSPLFHSCFAALCTFSTELIQVM